MNNEIRKNISDILQAAEDMNYLSVLLEKINLIPDIWERGKYAESVFTHAVV